MGDATRVQMAEADRLDFSGCATGCEQTVSRLVVIEPDTLVRESLVHLLACQFPYVHVEGAPSASLVRPGPASLVLVGIDPCRDEDLTTIAAGIWAVREKFAPGAVGAYLVSEAPDIVHSLAALDLAGVIQSDASAGIVVAAVHLMMVGGFYLPLQLNMARERGDAPTPPQPVASTIEAPAQVSEAVDIGADGKLSLTLRECDVLRSLREGRQNKLIAYHLGISESTVKVHLRSIMKKLHASNRTQVVLGAPRLD